MQQTDSEVTQHVDVSDIQDGSAGVLDAHV